MANNLIDIPFKTNPDPTLLYITPGLQAAMHKTRYVIDKRQGLTLIMGDVGLGKSTLLRYLYQSYDALEGCSAAFLPTPSYRSEFAFLKAICGEFDIPIRASMQKQEIELNNFLVEEFSKDRLVVVFIDEAQKIPGNQLELIRTLMNFETNSSKLIQVVLAAQLEIRDRLADKSKKAIRSRIFAPSLLESLTLQETADMIDFRCKQAGSKNPFSTETVEAIYQRTGGVPREILTVCAVAVEFANISGRDTISPDEIDNIYPEAIYQVEAGAV